MDSPMSGSASSVAAAASAAAAAPAAAQSASSASDPSSSAAGGKKRKRGDSADLPAAAAHAPAAAHNSAVAAAAAAPAPPLLIGAQGGEWIRAALAASHPAQFVQQFQAEHGVGNASLEASLSFLDLFAPRRGAIYSSMLQELNDSLTERIHKGLVDKDKMLSLLESSFAYIRVDELRGVPIALLLSLLSSTGAVPSKYLRALVASPPKLIESLPLPLRRCLMEAEPHKLFWSHAHWTALMAAYANDAARIDAYNSLLPLESLTEACKHVRKDGASGTAAATAASAAGGPAYASSGALQGMLEWIGSSGRLYDFTCAQLRELVLTAEQAGRPSDAQVWRSLRVDLLMRLHETQQQSDSGARSHHHHHHHHHSHSHGGHSHSGGGHGHAHAHSGKAHLASHIDPLHTWVWCLDAGVREQGLLSSKLVEKLLGSAEGGAAPASAPAAAAAGEHEAGGVPGFLASIKAKHLTGATLADLSMLASHPSIVRSLLHSILAALTQSVEQEITPREHTQLRPLTNLLHLALTPCTALVRPDAPAPPLHLPEPDDAEALYSEFYPFVAELIIYAQLGEMEPLNPKLLEHVASSPVARHVFLYYLLSRLQQQDIQQSGALLSCLPHIQVGGVSLWKAEMAQGEQSFLHSVLRTAASLIITVKNVLKTDSAFRTAVFPSCFLLLARMSPFAHEECLRMLLACVDCLTAEESAAFLAQLQREGKRSPSPPAASAATATEQAAAAATVATPSFAPVSSLSTQIAGLYQQFQAAHPQLFPRQAKK